MTTTKKERYAAAGITQLLGPGVYPDSRKGGDWRSAAAWGYPGIVNDSTTTSANWPYPLRMFG